MCMKLHSTTSHHWITTEIVKRAQEISQNNSQIISVKSEKEIISQINCQK